MQYLILIFSLLAFTVKAQQTLNPKFQQKIESTIDHTVTTISCQRLYKKLNTPELYILDAREQSEYNVSHLPKSLCVGYDDFNKNSVAHIPKDAIVVLYCSIGYRSEKIGEKLKKLGYQRVYNLYGGLFEWSNQQLPLENAKQQSTTKVHAYSKDWGRWIDKGEKVYRP